MIMNKEPKLKGKLLDTVSTPRLRGNLARVSMADAVDASLSAGELRGKGLEIGRGETPEPVYTSLKEGKKYRVLGDIDRSRKGLSPLVRLERVEDGLVRNIDADAINDPERFEPSID